MDDNRDLIERIRKAGEDEEIPQSLEPDNMRKRLEAFQRELDAKAEEEENMQPGTHKAQPERNASQKTHPERTESKEKELRETEKSADAESKEPENHGFSGMKLQERRTKRMSSWKIGGMAAAVVLVASIGAGRFVHNQDNSTLVSQESYELASAKKSEAEKEIKKADAEDANYADAGTEETGILEENSEDAGIEEKDVLEEDSANAGAGEADVISEDDEEIKKESSSEIPHAASYEELYERISQRRVYEKQGYMVEEGDMMYETVVQEDAAVFTDSSMASDLGASGTSIESSVSYSETNTREASVDEADIVKTDGEYIYVLNRSKGIAVLRKDGTDVKEESWISLEGMDDYPVEFYVDGNLLQLIVTKEQTEMLSSEEEAEWDTYYVKTDTRTCLITYDISDRDNPVKIGEYEQDGSYLTSRKNGRYVYLFTAYAPAYFYMTAEPETFVPKAGEGIILCEDIYYPFGMQEYTENNYLVISSVESDSPDKAVETKALLSRSDLFYVSEKHIYVVNSRWEESGESTSLASFAYDSGKIEPTGAGNIPGSLNNSFSLDEYNGYLRAVTTRWDYRDSTRSNALYILDENLNYVSKIDNLAEGEDIRSARFMGDTAYFVTYRNTDPLFSADLSDPQNPVILGELKVTGFSEYLHFYGENLLLGIGWETDPDTGIQKGLKLSMFDVSDPSNVTECSRMIIENVGNFSGSWNYRAVLVNPERNLIGLSFTDQNGSICYGVFSYEEGEFRQKMVDNLTLGSELGELDSIRGLFIDSCYYVSGNTGIAVYDMEDGFKKMQKLTW